MEDIPLPDASVDVVISNGVINLSFRKRTVICELFRVLKPGGRLSITDIVSAKQLSQSIVNDPKLWPAESAALSGGRGVWVARGRRVYAGAFDGGAGFGFRKESTRDAAEAYGVKAVLFTAQKPAT